MIKMREVIDTWNLVEKYDIKDWQIKGGIVLIPENEYAKLMAQVTNKVYIKNLTLK